MLVLTSDIASYKNHFPIGFIPENLGICFALKGQIGEPVISSRNIKKILFLLLRIFTHQNRVLSFKLWRENAFRSKN